MEKLLIEQYQLLKGSRTVLMDYCQTLTTEDFTRELKDFGRGSIRNLLVHIANTYEFWLGNFALNKNLTYTSPSAVAKASDMIAVFDQTNALVTDFLRTFGDRLHTALSGRIRDKDVTASPLTLFTHVITHEFHHKGQILSVSRHMGYTPVDTDIVR
jgi:uncharacterized damage-inducible protein DinB